MSFVSQPDTFHSQGGHREPRPRVTFSLKSPHSKPRSSSNISVTASDRSERSPLPSPILQPRSRTQFLTDYESMVYKYFGHLQTTTAKFCDTCGGRCVFSVYGDGTTLAFGLQPTLDWMFGTWPYYWRSRLRSRHFTDKDFLARLHLVDRRKIHASSWFTPTFTRYYRESLGYDTIACITRKVESPRNEEQSSHRTLLESKRQQKLLCGEKRTYQGMHERHEMPREPSRHPRVQQVNEMMLERTLSQSLKPRTEEEWAATHGRLSLKIWRRTAGRSKSWKRCSRSAEPRQVLQKQVSKYRSVFERQLSKSPLWIPAAFLRSQTKERSLRWSGVVLRQGPDPIPKQVRRYNTRTNGFQDTPVTIHGSYRSTAITQDPGFRESGPVGIDSGTREPAGAFMRFTWKDKILTNGKGLIDRFLPTGFVFRAGWRVVGFLRNESFADVYSLSRGSTAPSSATTEVSWEAHVFLEEYHGNCAVYARRLKNRMQLSGAILDTFWHGDRHVFILRVRRKPVQFRLRNTEEEFPILIDQNKCNEQVALQRRRFRGKPSFAAVAGRGALDVGFDHGPTPIQGGKSALQKELEQIGKARLKKAQKQRVKRQSQRDRRLTERFQSIDEAMGDKKAHTEVV